MEEILADIILLDFSFLLTILIKLVILLCIYYAGKRFLSENWQTIINLFVIIMIVRIILFENPAAWYIYNHTLDPEVIGWRQHSILYDEFDQYKKHDNVEYLAVGSSQTGAIYNFFPDTLPHFRVKSLAGLGTVDLYLYRKNILNYNPDNILLYLSDFDIGRPPAFEAYKLAPTQGIKYPTVYSKLKKYLYDDDFDRTIIEMLVGEFFPEYKYSYIFKGYIDQLFNKNKVFPSDAFQMSSEEYQKHQFEQLKTIISEENIEANLYYLHEFLTFFEEHGITVIILEGQYHPEAYTSKNIAVRESVRNELKYVDQNYSNVTFIPETEFMTFEPADYEDAYHVNSDGARRFMQTITHMNLLNIKH